MPKHFLLIAFSVIVLVMLSAGVSRSETGISLYTGETFIQDTNFNVSYHSSNAVSRLEHFDVTRTKGIRLDHWGDDWGWLGLSLDLASFEGRSDDIDLRVVSLSALLQFRLSFLKNQDHPHGSLHPYVGIGPNLVYYHYSLDFRPAITDVLSEASFNTGSTMAAGVTWQFSKHFGLFAEYRYIHFEIDDEEDSMGWILGFPTTVIEKINADVRTEQYLGGVSLIF